MAVAVPETTTKTSLVRGLGLLTAASVVIGNVIGTGVFLKARVMTCNVGSPGRVVTVWAVAGVLSLAGALTYAELAAMMPRAGGEYVFIRQAYGRLVSFLFGWTRFFVASTGASASLAAGFAIFINILAGGAAGGARRGVRIVRTPGVVFGAPGCCGGRGVDGHTDQLRGGFGQRPNRVRAHHLQDCTPAGRRGRRDAAGRWIVGALPDVGSGRRLPGRAGSRARRAGRFRCGDARRAVGVYRVERGHLRRRRGQEPATQPSARDPRRSWCRLRPVCLRQCRLLLRADAVRDSRHPAVISRCDRGHVAGAWSEGGERSWPACWQRRSSVRS